MRDYLNEGGKLLYHRPAVGRQGAQGQFEPARRSSRTRAGATSRSATATIRADVTNCVPLPDDFLQYYLGAYVQIDAAGASATTDAASRCRSRPKAGSATPRSRSTGRLGRQPGARLRVRDDLEHPAPGRSSRCSRRRARSGLRPAARPSTRRPARSTRVARVGRRVLPAAAQTIDLTGKTTARLRFKISYDTEPDSTTCSSRRTASARTTGRRCPTQRQHVTDSVGRVLRHQLGHAASVPRSTTRRHEPAEEAGDADCTPTGTTGAWNAATRQLRRLPGLGGRPERLRGQAGRGLDHLRQDFAVAGLGVVRRRRERRQGRRARSTRRRSRPTSAGGGPARARGQPEPRRDWERVDRRSAHVEGPGIATDDTVYRGLRAGGRDRRRSERRWSRTRSRSSACAADDNAETQATGRPRAGRRRLRS